MNMTDGEIISSYKQAKNRKAQVAILADLNSCERTEMERHLVKLGCIRDTPPPSFDYLRAAELYAEGKSDLEITEQLGAAKSQVVKWRKSKGFAANYPSVRAPALPKEKAARRAVAIQDAPAVLTVGRLAELLHKLAADTPEAVVLAGGAAITTVTVISDFGPDGAARRAEVRLGQGEVEYRMIRNLTCFKCHQDLAVLTYEENRVYRVTCSCGCTYSFEHSSMACAESYHLREVALHGEIDANAALRAKLAKKDRQLEAAEEKLSLAENFIHYVGEDAMEAYRALSRAQEAEVPQHPPIPPWAAHFERRFSGEVER